MHILPVRLVAAASAVLALLGGSLAGSLGGASAGAATPERAAGHRTTITFTTDSCEGCTLRLTQGRWAERDPQGIRVWQSPQGTVEDGAVSFTVPTRRTRGMSATLVAPWERRLGYVTTVAFRYGGEQPGERVGFREARSKHRASGCWAGTSADELTIPLTVRKVWVQGASRHHVHGTIAYTSRTRDWMVPMRRVWRGVMGAQDIEVCGKRAS